MKRLLLLSNSTNFGELFLHYPLQTIQSFLGVSVKSACFVPFAGVRLSYAAYARLVRDRLRKIGVECVSIHESRDPRAAVLEAQAIVVGGGNTFHLLNELYAHDLIEAIRMRVHSGIPYIGWSAGSNIACPTIQTTNDMPIVEPPSLKALGLVPFQINPHYTDARLPGHGGETRSERLMEFVEVNPDIAVIGLEEGSMLKLEESQIELLGSKRAKVFRKGYDPKDCLPGDSLQFLMP